MSEPSSSRRARIARLSRRIASASRDNPLAGVGNDELGGLGGRRGPHVRHQIGERRVDLVPDRTDAGHAQ